jgi:hypothetical protein
MDDKQILKLLWAKEHALKENLPKSEDAKKIQEVLWKHLDDTLPPDSIVGLRYQKLKANPKFKAWWSINDGYFNGNPWEDMIEPFYKILEQYLGGKTVKDRFSNDDFFVESRIQGEDEHIFIGNKDGTDKKSHLIIDGVTGEIRVDANDQPPEEILSRIETILTRRDGTRIRTVREVLDEKKD